jgi:hypothetical protein
MYLLSVGSTSQPCGDFGLVRNGIGTSAGGLATRTSLFIVDVAVWYAHHKRYVHNQLASSFHRHYLRMLQFFSSLRLQ